MDLSIPTIKIITFLYLLSFISSTTGKNRKQMTKSLIKTTATATKTPFLSFLTIDLLNIPFLC